MISSEVRKAGDRSNWKKWNMLVFKALFYWKKYWQNRTLCTYTNIIHKISSFESFLVSYTLYQESIQLFTFLKIVGKMAQSKREKRKYALVNWNLLFQQISTFLEESLCGHGLRAGAFD